jgi:ElaB/YqjD/DUF883 family membrane-anchored ribosome-binding protein
MEALMLRDSCDDRYREQIATYQHALDVATSFQPLSMHSLASAGVGVVIGLLLGRFLARRR